LPAVGAAVWSQKELERGSCLVAIGPGPWGGRVVRGPAVVAGCVAYTQRLRFLFSLSLILLFCSYSQEHSREEKALILSPTPLI
jgi:hypothetical protein